MEIKPEGLTDGDKSMTGPVDERRSTPRYKAEHIAHLLFIATILDLSFNAKFLPLTILGRTQNISRSGLMLKVSSADIADDYLAAQDYAMRIVVATPLDPVEIYARPAHYECLDEGGYLIGAQITRMDETERTRSEDYLQTLSS
jgi:hypothetical protein